MDYWVHLSNTMTDKNLLFVIVMMNILKKNEIEYI